MSEDQRGGVQDGPGAEEGSRTEEVPQTEQIPTFPQTEQFQALPQAEQIQAFPQTEQIQFQAPPPPPRPLTPDDWWRAATVAVLNLSGLGLGYALMRRWIPAAVCWVATGILLLVALPVEPSGVSGALLVVYVIFLVLAAAHGAYRALRTPLTWPRRPQVAGALAVVMLVVPIGGAALYSQAHANAVQQMLLGQLAQADNLVEVTQDESFADSEPQDNAALAIYRNLLENDRSSQAGQLVPNRLATFYDTVGSPYAAHDYCDAIAPLSYLRNVSSSIGAANLGTLATWPDDRLATSLYQCGTAALGTSGNSTATTDLSQLLTTFPASSQAAQVEPAVAAAINKAAVGIGGSNPCAVTTTLHTLGAQASALTGGTASAAAALHKDSATAGTDVEAGTYACGVSQYKSGDFTDAQTTMDNFATTYPHDPNDAVAHDFSIAAQVAEQEPAAGKVIPTAASGGSVSVTILNDSPDPLQILYTGPVTGTINIGACSSCTTYSSNATAQQDACSNSNINYPQATIDLLPGTTYFLQQNTDSSGAAPNPYSEQYNAGNAYEDCAYETASSIFDPGDV